MAIHPEVLSRGFCSIGQECRDEAGQFTRNGSGGPHAARRHASAQEKGLLPNEETADPEREWAPGADGGGEGRLSHNALLHRRSSKPKAPYGLHRPNSLARTHGRASNYRWGGDRREVRTLDAHISELNDLIHI